MNTEIDQEHRLREWKSGHIAGAPHLEDEALYRLACPGGIKSADSETARHLSLCPTCLGKWADWRRAITYTEEIEREVPQTFMSYGMLEAAATDGPRQPLNLKSQCGSFSLALLPQADNPEQGLLTLDAVGQVADTLEGQRVKVRDRNGRVLIDGPLRGGRIARPCTRLSAIDLSTWTIDFSAEDEA